MIKRFQVELQRVDDRIASTRQYLATGGNHQLGMLLLARLKCRRRAVLALLRSFRLERRMRAG